MRTKNVATFLVLAAVCLLVSCNNFTIPEAVSVKTNASYKVNLGNISKDMTEYISAVKIKSAGSSTVKIYDYKPAVEPYQTVQTSLIVCTVLTIRPFATLDSSAITIINGLPDNTNLGSYVTLSGTVDTGINMQELISGTSDSILKKLNFTSVPVYIAIQKPDAIKITGTISAITSTTTTQIINNTTTDGITNCSVLPETAENESTSVTNDISTTSGITGGTDFAAVMNEWPSSLSINYALTPAKVAGKAVAAGDTISVTLYLILPYDFKVSEDISLDLSSYMNLDSTTDMFGRSSATDNTNSTYYDAIKSITFSCPCVNNTGLPDTTTIILSSTAFDTDKTFSLSSGTTGISVSKDEITNMLKSKNYPFMPLFTASILKDSEIKIPRKATFSLTPSVTIDTDGTIQITGSTSGGN